MSIPSITRILETALYCPDLEAAEAFYTRILGLEPFAKQKNRHIFFRIGDAMLLLFNPDATREGGAESSEVPVGAHGSWGQGHAAFAASDEEIDLWKGHLEAHGTEVEQDVRWPQGGRSIYFRDPAGNSLEFATPRLWDIE